MAGRSAAVVQLFGLVGLLMLPVCSSGCTNARSVDSLDLVIRRINSGCPSTGIFKIECHFEENLDYSREHIPFPRIYTIRQCGITIFQTSISSRNETMPVFSGLHMKYKITGLRLDNLGISKITNTAFSSQNKLEIVSLKGNELSEIGDGVFDYLSELKVLDLSENRIKEIKHDEFRGLPLQELHLSKNQLTYIPLHSELNVLDVSYNHLSQINPGVFFKTTILNVSNNDISYINMSCFSKIELLNIANNNINKTPVFYTHSQNLRELYLSNTNLSNISNGFLRNLSQLRVLDVSRNRVSGFAFGTFDDLENLTSLNISYNALETLPVLTFYPLKQLTELYIQGNNVKDLNINNLLEHLPTLKLLDLRYNLWSCHSLFNVTRSLLMHKVSIKRGNFTEGSNIYGMRCSQEDVKSVTGKESESVKYMKEMNKSKRNESENDRDLLYKTLEAVDRLNNNILLKELSQNASTEKLEVLSLGDPTELRSYPPDKSTCVEGVKSVLIFIAVVLTLMTSFIAVLVYVILFKWKYGLNGKPEVELTHLQQKM